MRLYVAHTKSGKCPKGSTEVRRKGKSRCKWRFRKHLSGKKY